MGKYADTNVLSIKGKQQNAAPQVHVYKEWSLLKTSVAMVTSFN